MFFVLSLPVFSSKNPNHSLSNDWSMIFFIIPKSPPDSSCNFLSKAFKALSVLTGFLIFLRMARNSKNLQLSSSSSKYCSGSFVRTLSFIPLVLDSLSILLFKYFIPLVFNCVGFSCMGFSCVGFSNIGFSSLGSSNTGFSCVGFS